MYLRRQTRPKPLKSQLKQWVAPTAGWISNRALADASSIEGPGAAILDNFFPRQTGVMLRRGKELYATLEDETLAVTSLFSYQNGNNRKLFASNIHAIYNITVVPNPAFGVIVTEDGDSIVTQTGDWFGWVSITSGLAVMTGLTGGNWITTQFATTGGVYLLGVNGADTGFIYDGTAFAPWAGITFGASGLTTADMSFVWVYKSRVWFIQTDSLSAWYLEVDSIAGAAVEFPMGGVFAFGGSLLFGSEWSMESAGQGGLSEQNTFTTTLGEVAVYQGSNPDDATDWSKVGVYRIGAPLGNRAFMHGGGDLAIATTVGLVPLSKAIALDVTALNVATVSYKISDAWADALAQRGPTNWQAHLWAEAKMALIGLPDTVGSTTPAIFVSNTDGGAWCRFTGWQAYSFETFEGDLYFGSGNGQIFIGMTGGMDHLSPYTGVCVPLFEDLGNPAAIKVATVARARLLCRVNAAEKIAVVVDYNTHMLPSAPDATPQVGGDIWGAGIWGTSHWQAPLPTHIVQPWRSAGGMGYAMSVCFQITSGSLSPLDCQIVDMELMYTTSTTVA